MPARLFPPFPCRLLSWLEDLEQTCTGIPARAIRIAGSTINDWEKRPLARWVSANCSLRLKAKTKPARAFLHGLFGLLAQQLMIGRNGRLAYRVSANSFLGLTVKSIPARAFLHGLFGLLAQRLMIGRKRPFGLSGISQHLSWIDGQIHTYTGIPARAIRTINDWEKTAVGVGGESTKLKTGRHLCHRQRE